MKLNISLFTLLLLIAVGCNKKNCEEDTITPIDISQGPCNENYNKYSATLPNYVKKTLTNSFGWHPDELMEGVKYGYSQPRINPDNPYELVFVRQTATNIQEICKYNFCTNKTTIILKDHELFSYGLNFSTNNWMIFTSKDQNLYKLKSNGDSLTQLTTSGNYNQDGKLSPDGTKLGYFEANNFYVADIDGQNRVLHPPFHCYFWYWLSNTEVLGISGFDVTKFDLTTDTWFTYPYHCPNVIHPIFLNQNTNHFYFSYVKGSQLSDVGYFMDLNLTTQEVDTVTTMNDSYYIHDGTYATQTDKSMIVLSVSKWKNDDSTTNVMQHKVMLVISDGTAKEFKEIIIPE